MKSQFVRLYLLFIGITLGLTALAKLPAIFHPLTMCIEYPILGNYQPVNMSNEILLGIAASSELAIVALICFSPWRWLPCLAAASWGSFCMVLRLYVIDPNVDCGCLGWLAKPSPLMNLVAGLLALVIAAGGWTALWIEWHRGGQ